MLQVFSLDAFKLCFEKLKGCCSVALAELQNSWIKLTSTKYVPHALTYICMCSAFGKHICISCKDIFKGTLILTTRGQKLTNKVRSYCTHTEPEPHFFKTKKSLEFDRYLKIVKFEKKGFYESDFFFKHETLVTWIL